MIKQTNPSNLVSPVSFSFICCYFIFCLYSFLKICYFHYPSALHEKLKFDLVHIIAKIKSILPTETITAAMGKTIRMAQYTITINFDHEFCDVRQNEETYCISYLLISNFNSWRFLKTTEVTQIEINESLTVSTPDNFVDTKTTIYNDCRTVFRPDTSPTDTSPRANPRLTLLRWTLPRRTFHRTDNSPTGLFPD